MSDTASRVMWLGLMAFVNAAHAVSPLSELMAYPMMGGLPLLAGTLTKYKETRLSLEAISRMGKYKGPDQEIGC